MPAWWPAGSPATWPGVQERLRAAELARAAEAARAEEAEAKAAAERRARRLTRALAATVLIAGGLFGAGWRWVELDRLNRTTRGDGARQRRGAGRRRGCAARRRGRRWATWPRGTPRWPPPRRRATSWSRASSRACGSRSRTWPPTSPPSAAGPAAAAEAAGRDRRLLDRLTDIRSAKADDRLGDGTDAAYGDAFREAGYRPRRPVPRGGWPTHQGPPPGDRDRRGHGAGRLGRDPTRSAQGRGRREAAGRGRPAGRPRPVAEPASRRRWRSPIAPRAAPA